MARRLIIDAVNQVGEVIRFPLTKKLLSYASSARKKYYHYREKEKGSWKRRRKCEKEKADEEEQAQMKAKRTRLAENIRNLETAADNKSLEAEKTRKHPFAD